MEIASELSREDDVLIAELGWLLRGGKGQYASDEVRTYIMWLLGKMERAEVGDDVG